MLPGNKKKIKIWVALAVSLVVMLISLVFAYLSHLALIQSIPMALGVGLASGLLFLVDNPAGTVIAWLLYGASFGWAFLGVSGLLAGGVGGALGAFVNLRIPRSWGPFIGIGVFVLPLIWVITQVLGNFFIMAAAVAAILGLLEAAWFLMVRPFFPKEK
jgi:hypothetical protein